MDYPDTYKMHGVTQGHARAWNSVPVCNGRRSPTFNYRGSYSAGSYAGTLCIVALRKVGVGPRKAAAQRLTKTETCCELLVKSQLRTILRIFIVSTFCIKDSRVDR
jgi:hypothetical protein